VSHTDTKEEAMTTRSPIHVAGRAAFVIILVVAAWGVGCAEQGSAEKLADDAPLFVSTTPTSVTLRNQTGLPLTDVKIVVVPYGPVQFAASFSRLEASDRRELALGDFRSSDGAPLNPRFIKPRSVRATAKDIVGKSYDVEVPWK